MIRAALQDGSSSLSMPSRFGPASDRPERESARPDGLGCAAADRLCAWAGRSGRRLVFSVIRLDPLGGAADVPLGPGMLVLAVQRPATGPRRVVWAAAVETEAAVVAVRHAASALALQGGGELHCRVSSDAAETTGLAAEFETRLSA